VKATILSLIAGAMFTGVGYGVLSLADGRYVRQDTWIAESRAQEKRHLHRRIDELEYQKEQRDLTAKEQWELRRLWSEMKELK
jgi:hypothetical protein